MGEGGERKKTGAPISNDDLQSETKIQISLESAALCFCCSGKSMKPFFREPPTDNRFHTHGESFFISDTAEHKKELF